MKFGSRYFWSLLGALVATAGSALAEAPRVALVIGCGEYRATDERGDRSMALPTPPQDARSVARLLASSALGFEVVGAETAGEAVIDPTRDDFFRALDIFRAKARGASLAVIYYSGHGIEENGDNYLLPVDATLSASAQLRSQAVNLRTLMDDLGETRASAKVVILDCCRNNPFRKTRSWAKSRSFKDEVLAELGEADVPDGTAILFATGPGRKAADRLSDSAANSPFTTHLLAQLAQPGQHVLAAFGKIESATSRDTDERQIPRTQLNGSLGLFQQVAFTRGAAPAVASEPPQRTAPQSAPLPNDQLAAIMRELQELKAARDVPPPAPPRGTPWPAEVAPPQPEKKWPAPAAGPPSDFVSFFETMIRHNISNDSAVWAGDFAASVDYGYKTDGKATRSFIQSDRRKLIARYPARSYDNFELGSVEAVSQWEVRASYSFTYSYLGTKRATGRARVQMTARKIDGLWQITSWRETVDRH